MDVEEQRLHRIFPSIPSILGFVSLLITICLIHCMLVRRAASKGSVAATSAYYTSQSGRLLRPRGRAAAHPFRPYNNPAALSKPQTLDAMLRGAVQKHEQENRSQSVLGKTLSQQLFSSSPPQPLSPSKPAAKSVSAGFQNNALKPSGPSTHNQMRPPQREGASANGIKRTASGVPKSFGGSFEDDRGTQSRPIMVNGARQPSQMVQADLFDEDEFSSDIELDIEQPRAKGGVSYPNLPKAQPNTSVPKQQSATNPSLAGKPTPGGYQDSRYGSFEPATVEQVPGSSAPLPWSSSPTEHLEPSRDISSIRKLAYTGEDNPQAQNGELPPTKRRILPWLRDGGDGGVNEGANASAKRKPSVMATPAPKESKKSAFPWNTTASAIKDQQKKHREETKKAVRNNAGTEESISKAKSKGKKVARVFLSEEQQHVLDLVVEQKKSVFFTGSAGTGKSVLLREIIQSLRKKYMREPDRVATTASTGLAACNVGGVTLHSFAGVGLGKEDAPVLIRKIRRNQKAKHRWMRTKVLIIDEVSMVDAEFFDKLENIARSLRNNGRAFGGIQLVITGDFFQLPPVPDSGKIAKFAFDAATWNTAVEHTIGLHHVFRQKDPVFAGMLNEMREGRLTESSIRAFRSLNRDLNFEDSLDATELFPLRSEVERANATRLGHLQGNVQVFEARDGGTIVDKMQRDKLLSNCMAPESITLKKGAQVMLIKNVDESLVNGSIGRVIGFMDEGEFDKYCIDEEAYTQATDGMLGTQQDAATKEERARKRLQDNLTTARKFPLVRFALADGNTRDLLCQPESWKVELPNGEVQASRSQVPLILAWALSIHKAQGQTLDRVKVDLGKVFEKGQAYVALSRATSMAGLQVLRFDPKKVNAHEKVRTFYSNLARVELEDKGKPKGGVKKTGVKAEDYEKRFVEDDWADMP